MTMTPKTYVLEQLQIKIRLLFRLVMGFLSVVVALQGPLLRVLLRGLMGVHERRC